MESDNPRTHDRLPAGLRKQLDALSLRELQTVRSYVEDVIRGRRVPFTERILAEATGQVVGIEDHGASTLVRKRLREDSPVVSLYHVREAIHPDGDETLHWAFLGDVRHARVLECSNCGGPVDERAPFCPHCGADDPNGSDHD